MKIFTKITEELARLTAAHKTVVSVKTPKDINIFKPTALYLGFNEFNEVSAEPHAGAYLTLDTDEQTWYLNWLGISLPVFKVNKTNHFAITVV